MTQVLKKRCCMMGAGIAAAAFLAACGGDTTVPNPGTSPAAAGIEPTTFSTFVSSTFADSATSTPIEINALTFVFDVNEDPAAFDAQLM